MADQKDDFKKILEKVKTDVQKTEELRHSLEQQSSQLPKQSSLSSNNSLNNLKLHSGRDPSAAAKNILELYKFD